MFSKKSNLNHHVKIAHEKRRFQCPECESDYTSAFRLRTHMKKEHSKGIVNAKSAIIIVGKRNVKVAPEAKSELIRAQREKIDELKKKIREAKHIDLTLTNQIQAERN